VTTDGPPRALLIAAISVAVAAIVVVLAIAAIRQSKPEQQPVAIASVSAPRADSTECQTLLGALPEQLGDYRRAPTAQPTPAGAAAWQADADDEPVILRCGVDRPADFIVGAPIQVVDPVQWFRVGEDRAGEAGVGEDRAGEAGVGDDRAGDGRTTWYAVDRPVYVALTLPQGSGPTAIQQISEVVAESLPTTPINPAPAR
jgi:hypothetical protein